MKKVLALVIIFLFVFTSNLIAAPITVNTMETPRKNTGNAWPQDGWNPTLPVVDETVVLNIEGRELSVFSDTEPGMAQSGGSLTGSFFINDSVFSAPHKPVAPVPEPASLLLLGVGMLSAGFFARKKKKNS